MFRKYLFKTLNALEATGAKPDNIHKQSISSFFRHRTEPTSATNLYCQSIRSLFVLGCNSNNINSHRNKISALAAKRLIGIRNNSNNNKHSIRIPKRRSLEVTITPLANKFKMEWPKITLFGDSITRRSMDPDNGCWGSLIAHQVGNYCDVDFRGFEGYSSQWVLELMPNLFPKSYLDKVEIFIPFFGHNDSWDKTYPASVTPEKYEANMRAIIKHLLDNGVEKRKIILITPSWYHEEAFLRYLKEIGLPPVGKELADAKKYSDAILRIAKEDGYDVVDFFDITSKHEPLEELFCDGVHFSQKGARMLANELMPIIGKKLEESFKKPLGDLWHVIPIDQRSELKPLIEAYQASIKKISP